MREGWLDKKRNKKEKIGKKKLTNVKWNQKVGPKKCTNEIFGGLKYIVLNKRVKSYNSYFKIIKFIFKPNFFNLVLI